MPGARMDEQRHQIVFTTNKFMDVHEILINCRVKHNVCLCIYVHICINVCVYVYVCVYERKCVCVCFSVFVCLCMFRLCLCLCVCGVRCLCVCFIKCLSVLFVYLFVPVRPLCVYVAPLCFMCLIFITKIWSNWHCVAHLI